MNRIPAPITRHIAALRAMLVFTVICGIAYPLVMVGIAQAAFSRQANGSLIKDSAGRTVGSSLLCQEFVDAKGDPLAQYFQVRPSNASNASDSTDYGCDALYSGGTNLGPNSPELLKNITTAKAAVAKFDGVPQSAVPADAVTASASGLDPDISPAYAAVQARRIAAVRGLPLSEVRTLIARNTTGRVIGFLGEPVVNVLELNLALDKASPCADTCQAAATGWSRSHSRPAAGG
jgi:K+-transporting ATPase ATPase C chain